MTSRYGFLCLLAIVAIVLLVIKNYETWTVPLKPVSERIELKNAGIKPEVSQTSGNRKELQKESPEAIAAYIFISEKNPFNPDRKEFPIPAPAVPPAAEVKKSIVRPQVTLYGLTIAGDYRSASLSYQGRVLQKGEREVMTVKIGDRVAEYKVVKISEDRIELETQGDNFEVLLYDVRAPKKRVYAKTENKPLTPSTVPTTPGTAPEPVKLIPAQGGPSKSGAQEPTRPIPSASTAAPRGPLSPTAVIPSSSPPSDINARTRRNQQSPPSGELRYPPPTPPGQE